MFTATCSNCGREAQVPFRPTSGKPVYCSDCFRSMRGNSVPDSSPGRPPSPTRPATPSDPGRQPPGSFRIPGAGSGGRPSGRGSGRRVDHGDRDLRLVAAALAGDETLRSGGAGPRTSRRSAGPTPARAAASSAMSSIEDERVDFLAGVLRDIDHDRLVRRPPGTRCPWVPPLSPCIVVGLTRGAEPASHPPVSSALARAASAEQARGRTCAPCRGGAGRCCPRGPAR